MIEFKQKLDSNKSAALNKSVFKKMIWLYIILSTVMILCGVVGIIFKEDSADVASGIGLIIAGVLITPLGYLLTRFLQKRNDKSTVYISLDTEEIFTFDEQYITVTQTKGDEYFATTKAKYSYIYKAQEDDNYFYLYISKMQSHVIDKSSITQGTLEEFSALLKNNLGDKFRSK